jgi:DeoR family glycerol-3-phosphate regulon repressor
MLAGERHKRIVELVNTEGFVQVKELAKMFSVTEDSIRKDLKILENKHLLTRIHGGATTIRQNVHAYNVEERKNTNPEGKDIIAKKAMTLMKNRDVIYLDISTSSLAIAKQIIKEHLEITVLTNMIDIMMLLKDDPYVNLIFIGGRLNHGADGFVGSATIEMLRDFKYDLAFLGVVGVNMESNIVMTYDIDDGLTKKQIMRNARASYMLCEHEKCSREGHYIYATLDDFRGFITDAMLNDNEEKILISKDVEIL